MTSLSVNVNSVRNSVSRSANGQHHFNGNSVGNSASPNANGASVKYQQGAQHLSPANADFYVKPSPQSSSVYSPNANLIPPMAGSSNRLSSAGEGSGLGRPASNSYVDNNASPNGSPNNLEGVAPGGAALTLGGWSQHYDSKGNSYWFNTSTGESSWTKPAAAGI